MSLRVCTPAPVEPRSNKVSNSNTNQARGPWQGGWWRGGGGGRVVRHHMSILRKSNIAMSNSRNSPVALLTLTSSNVAISSISYVACH